MRQTLRLAVCALPLVFTPVAAAAQVSIAPPILFLNDATRISDFAVGNTSDAAREVTIDFRFGYMRSDTLGNLAMEYDDSAAAGRHSMAEWVVAFPRRFVLPPGAEQIVRIMARPPRDLATGVYWTRLITASVPQSVPIDSVTQEMSAQITVRVEQVSTVLFRRGEEAGGVDIGVLALHRDSAGTHLLIPLAASRGSPFLGHATVTLKDERGALVHEMRAPLAVYFRQVQRVTLPATAARGTYRADVSIQAGRADVPRWAPRPSSPVTAALQFTLP